MTKFQKILEQHNRNTPDKASGASEQKETKFSKILKAHTADVDENTVNQFLTASGNYQRQRTRSYNDLNWQTGISSDSSLWDNEESKAMTATAKKVRTWAWANREQLAPEVFEDLTSYVDDFLTYQMDSAKDFRMKAEGMKQYKTQEEYDQAVRSYDEYGHKYTGKSYAEVQRMLSGLSGEEKEWAASYADSVKTKEDWEKELSQAKEDYAYLQKLKSEYDRLVGVTVSSPDSPNYASMKGQWDAYQNQFDNLEKRLEDKKAEIWDLERTVKYYNLSQSLDYGEMSQYQGEGDRTQQLVNNQESAGKWDTAWMVQKYLPIIPGMETLARVKELWGYENLHLMEEPERKNFNYLYNTQGEDAAKEYLDWLQYTLNARSKQKVQSWVADRTRDIPVLSQAYTSLLRTPVALLSGEGILDAVAQKAINTVSGEWKPVDYNRDGMMASVASNAVSNTVAADIQSKLGTVAAKAYQLGMSMQDSAAIAALSMINPALGQVGTVLLGGSAATQTMLDSIERGASDEQAIGLGLLSGAFEIFFEKYELDELLDNVKNAAKGAGKAGLVKTMARQALSEGVGEGATEIANILADCAVMAEKSNWQVNIEKYITEKNMTREEAEKQAFVDAALQVGEAFAGGLVSGTIMSGGMMGINAGIAHHQETTSMHNAAVDEFYAKKYKEDIPGLVQSVLQIDPENQMAKTVQEKLNNGETVTDQELRQLAEPVAAAEMEKTASARLRELGENGDVAALSKVIAKYATGQKLTTEEKAALKASDYSSQVATEISKSLKEEGKQAKKYGKDTVKDQRKLQKDLEKAVIKYNKEARKGTLAPDTALQDDIGPDETTEENFEVADDGATVHRSTGKVVKIKDVAFKNGKLTLRTEEGSEVAASDVSYGTEAEAMVYEAVAQLDGIIDGKTATKLSRNLIRQINEGDAISDHYIQAVAEAYRLGYNGPDIEEVRANADIASELTERQLNYAYNMGKKYAEDTKSARSNNVTKTADNVTKDTKIRKKTAKRSKAPDGKSYDNVQFESKVKSWGDKQRADVEFLNFVARDIAGGVTVHVFESFKGKDGNRYYYDSDGKLQNAPNGRYIHANGDIYLDLNAGDSGEGLVLNTFAHELYHHIEQWSPAKARQLAEFLVKEQGLDSVGAMVQAQIEKAEAAGHGVKYFMQQGMSRTAAENTVKARAFSDFVADSLETVFTKGDAMEILQRLKKSDQGLFDKIKAFVDKWVSKLKKYYQGDHTISIEGQTTAQLETFQQIQELFMEALVDAGENYRNADTVAAEKSTADGGEMYQERNTKIASYKQPITNQDILILRSIGRKSINQFTPDDLKKSEKWAYKFYKELGVKSPFFRSWFGDWRANSTDPAEIVEFTYGENGKINYRKRTVKNRDMNGKRITVDDTVIEDSVHYAKQNGDEKQIKKLLAKIDEILEKGILLDTQISVKSSGNKKGSTQFMHYLYTPISINGALFIAKSSVEEYDLTSQTRAYNLRRITLSALSRAQFAEIISQNRGKYAYSADALSVSQLFDFVKQNDSDFHPNPPSYVVNEDGTPKIMYHGTNANWTAYDISKNVNQAWGEGIYLAETAERASLYGDHVKALYVKAVYNNRDAKRLGTDRDHIRMKNGDILVFSPNQIKSATDNIGTFDGANADIDFSDRNVTPTSNRSLLANALETAVQNDEERQKLQDYRNKINQIEADEQKLLDLKKQLYEMSFAKGPRDAEYREKMSRLQKEAASTERRLNKNEKEVLNLEATKPLQDLLQREKDAVKRRMEKKHRQSLRTQKEEAAKEQAALKAEYATQREKAVESRKRTEMRNQISRDVKNIYKLYNRGKDANNVKEEMKEFVFQALSSAELLLDDLYTDDDMIRNGMGIKLSPKANALLQRAKTILYRLDKLADPAESTPAKSMEEYNREEKRLKLELSEIKTEMQMEFRRERWEQKGSIVSMVMQDLCDAYKELANSMKPYIRNAYHPFVQMHLEGVRERLKATRVEDMTLDELTEIHEAYTMVLKSIRDANKAFCANRSIDYIAKQLISEFSGQRLSKSKIKNLARNVSDYVGWNYEKLYYALERIGSATFTQLFVNLANAENIIMEDIAEAKAYQRKLVNDYGYNKWSVNEKVDREFVDNLGHSFQLTLGEIMLLYAYTRRGNVWKQLEIGGFVLEKKALTDDRNVTAYKLTQAQCLSITNTLTAEQKHFVEGMQKYLSDVMGAKGNEVSMKLYGVKLYNDPNYCPVHVAGQYQARVEEATAKKQAGFESLAHTGFTKTKNIDAKATIVMESFMDIWVDHVNEMSRYHGAVPALEDIRRVMNYSDYSNGEADSVAVKAMMENRYGKQAVNYFDDLYREVNSGAVLDKLQSLPKKALSKTRKLAVAYSLSVLVQQPSSISRAFAMVDPKYFAGLSGAGASAWGVAKTVTNRWSQKQTAAYAEMVKYAPGVTLAKEIGGFDASGGGIRNYLMDTEKSLAMSMKTGTTGEKLQAVGKKIDDNWIANLPNLADKIAWIEIWNACKREVKDKHRSMDVHDEPYMKLVGQRFTEVIRATQVYDSVFAKSPLLKSKNVAVQYLVSYMNEPNVVANMAESAIRDIRKGGSKNIMKGAKKLAAVTRSIIFCNVLKSLVYAMRDDDEDETYIEKYLQALTGNLISDATVFNYIPFVRDIWSVFRGYDVERPDISIFSDLIFSIKKYYKVKNQDISEMSPEELEEWDSQCTEADWGLIGAIAGCFGIPIKNMYREINSVFSCVRICGENAGKTTWKTFGDACYQGVVDALPFHDQESKSDKLYEALTEGDTKYLERLQAGYLNSDGDLKTSYYTALRKGLREHDPRIQAAAAARKGMDTDEYLSILGEIVAEGHFSEKDVVAAIRSEYNQLKDADSAKLLFEAMASGDKKTAEELKSNFVNDKGEFSERSYRSAIQKGLRENDPRILQAAEAKLNRDFTTANKILSQIAEEGRFHRSDISAAITDEYNDMKDD